MQDQSRGAGGLLQKLYTIQTVLKVVFIPMTLFNLRFTLMLGLLASLVALYRVLKAPQLSKEYLNRVLTNNHGQNLIYISLGAVGHINFLFYAPIVLFFGFGVVEFVKMRYPVNKYSHYVDQIRNHKYFVMETKGRLQILFWVYLVVTLPFDFMGRVFKVFLMGQYLLVKYKMNNEFRVVCTGVNNLILGKTLRIEALHSNYLKLSNWVHSYANRDIVRGQ